MPSCNDENRTSGLNLRQAALIAGLTYLLNPVTFSEAYVMPRLVSADPVETLRNLTAHPHLFSAAVLSYVISAVGDVVMAWALYVLLQPIDRALAMLGSVLQLVYASVWLATLTNLGLIYRLVAVRAYSRRTSAVELPSQIADLFGAYYSGWGLSLILFGLHLVVTGWLIARSSYLPRWIGWLLFLAGWAWVVDSVALYFVPEPHLSFLKVIFAAELIFMVWLLGWGWRITEPQFLAKESH